MCVALVTSTGALRAATPASSPAFADLVGWWAAEPVHAGESSRVLLRFAAEDGKQVARLSLVAIDNYDFQIGTVTVEGDLVRLQPTEFPLRYDDDQQTLSGVLPAAALPIYRVPVEFRRISDFKVPAPRAWQAATPAVKWQVPLGASVWAGLTHDAATKSLFVGTDAGVLHALDERGQSRWTHDLGAPIKAAPAIVGEDVLVASDAGVLVALNKHSGEQRWRTTLAADAPARIAVGQPNTRWDRYASSLVADDSSLYVASRDHHLYALDRRSGAVRWRFASRDIATSTPALYEDLVLFASFDGTVYAVERASGRLRWQHDTHQAIPGDLSVSEGRVFAGSRSYELIALNARNGERLWAHYYWFSWIESSPSIVQNTIYTGSSDAVGVYAIDTATGVRQWKATVPGWAWARPAVASQVVVAGTVGKGPVPSHREGALVGLDRATGALQWLFRPASIPTESEREWGFAAAPLIVDGVVYAVDLAGMLYALDAP